MYTLTLLAAGVPSFVVGELKPHLSNMLGLVRGNIYYNLTSWYRCLVTLPIGDTSKYMETMMGVKQVGFVEGGRSLADEGLLEGRGRGRSQVGGVCWRGKSTWEGGESSRWGFLGEGVK